MVTLAVSGTVFEILMLKGRKRLILPTPPLFRPPLGGNPLEFRDETYPRKTRGMGLLCGENCVILASTVFDWSTCVTDRRTDRQTDRQTDGIAMAYTRYSIYAVARKNTSHFCRCKKLTNAVAIIKQFNKQQHKKAVFAQKFIYFWQNNLQKSRVLWWKLLILVNYYAMQSFFLVLFLVQ